MAVGPTPLYLQVLQWANMIIQLIYPIAMVVILALALVEFKKLVSAQQSKARSSSSRVGRSKSKAVAEEE